MTVIAIRDGVIASDSMATWDGSRAKQYCEKIYLESDYVWGATGYAIQARVMLQGILSDSIPEDWPTYAGDDDKEKVDFNLIHIPKKSNYSLVDIYDETGHKDTYCTDPYIAFGSGMTLALGAMFAGADAVEAVQAAMEHNPFCGGWVDIIDLNKWTIERKHSE